MTVESWLQCSWCYWWYTEYLFSNAFEINFLRSKATWCMGTAYLLAVVDQAPANVLNASIFHKAADTVIVHTSTQGTKKVNGLAREGVHDFLDLAVTDVVVLHSETITMLHRTNTLRWPEHAC